MNERMTLPDAAIFFIMTILKPLIAVASTGVVIIAVTVAVIYRRMR